MIVYVYTYNHCHVRNEKFLKNFRSVHTHFDTYLLNAKDKRFMKYHFSLSALFCASKKASLNTRVYI